MEMTEQEILRSYRGAKNKCVQIAILAEMNCCRQVDIKHILKNNGENIVIGHNQENFDPAIYDAMRRYSKLTDEEVIDKIVWHMHCVALLYQVVDYRNTPKLLLTRTIGRTPDCLKSNVYFKKDSDSDRELVFDEVHKALKVVKNGKH